MFGGDLEYGVGNDEIDLLKLAADTPVRVNTAEDNTVTNTWTNVKDGNRVVSTLIGEARTTSAAISRETWWPQCDVEFNQAGEVVSDKCGADMTSNVTNDYMVFSSVPARLAVIVEEQVKDVAGGIVSTNGQGFAFGRQTFAETDPAYEFTSSGPSYDSAGDSAVPMAFTTSACQQPTSTKSIRRPPQWRQVLGSAHERMATLQRRVYPSRLLKARVG